MNSIFLLLEMTGFLCGHVVAPLNAGLVVGVYMGGGRSIGDVVAYLSHSICKVMTCNGQLGGFIGCMDLSFAGVEGSFILAD